MDTVKGAKVEDNSAIVELILEAADCLPEDVPIRAQPAPEPEPESEQPPLLETKQEPHLPALAAAAAQANGLCALAVRGHPNLSCNSVYMPSKPPRQATYMPSKPPYRGWTHYESLEPVGTHIVYHNGRWVFRWSHSSEELREEDLDGPNGPTSIIAHEGPVPVGHHSWCRKGRSVVISVVVLATVAEVEAHAATLRAEREAAEQAAKDVAQHQLVVTRAVCIEGSQPKCNGVYVCTGEDDGWMRFVSEEGMHLYHSNQHWFLSTEVNLGSGAVAIGADDGPLPVGEQEWTSAAGPCRLTATLLHSEAEVTMHVQRLRHLREDLLVASKLAAQQQLTDTRAICIEGLLSWPKCNGVYVCMGEEDGWMRFASEEGMHLYHGHNPMNVWNVGERAELTPGRDSAIAFIGAVNGPLPIGEHEWQVHDGQRWSVWRTQLLTATLLHSEVEVAEHTERLRQLREHLFAEQAATHEAKVARTAALTVDEYAGEEVTMLHGTNSRTAQLIVRSQQFKPSSDGMLGKGVYVTTSREKAGTYRYYHPNSHTQLNDPLPNGEPDPGCILKFRVRLGFCKSLSRRDPLMNCWHDVEVTTQDMSLNKTSWEAATRANAKFRGDLELVQPYAQRFLSVVRKRLPTKYGSLESPQLRIVYNSAFSAGCPCTPRCKKGMGSCPHANGVIEEWCIYDPDRIDHIEIICGPGQGDGPQYWNMDRNARDEAFDAASGESWFDADKWWTDTEAAAAVPRAMARVQLAGTAAVCVEGLSHPEYNGVYMRAGEHNGWMKFASEDEKYLCRYQPNSEWWLHSEPTLCPNTLMGHVASIASGDGLLPVGEHEWQAWWQVPWNMGPGQAEAVTVTLLQSEVEIAEHTERLRQLRERLVAAAKLAAQQQLAETRAVCIEGLLQPEYNGIYIRAGEHYGRMRFASEEGKELSHDQASSEWWLIGLQKGDDINAGACAAWIAAGDGLLPVGEHEWKVLNMSPGKSGIVTVTVTLLQSEVEIAAHTERLRQLRERLVAAAKLAAQQQLAETRAVCIQGPLSHPEYNGVYRRVGEHDDWMRFASEEGKELSRYQASSSWWLQSEPNPDPNVVLEPVAFSTVACDGLLPVGEHEWIVWNMSSGQDEVVTVTVTVTVTLLQSEVEVAEQAKVMRERLLVVAALAPKLAAQQQLANTTAICIEGLQSWPEFNSVYVCMGEEDGWMQFASEEGMHLYRHQPLNSWHLNSKLTPDHDSAVAFIGAADGPLPVGEQEWQVCNSKSQWQSHSLTAMLLHNEMEIVEHTERLRVLRQACADRELPQGTCILLASHGPGTYVSFKRKRVGANQHTIEFEKGGRQVVELKGLHWSTVDGVLTAAVDAELELGLEPEPQPELDDDALAMMLEQLRAKLASGELTEEEFIAAHLQLVQ